LFLGLEESDISRTNITLTIIEEDSQIAFGKGLHQTDMSIRVFAETEREDFH
jgi:hypothetical protein